MQLVGQCCPGILGDGSIGNFACCDTTAAPSQGQITDADADAGAGADAKDDAQDEDGALLWNAIALAVGGSLALLCGICLCVHRRHSKKRVAALEAAHALRVSKLETEVQQMQRRSVRLNAQMEAAQQEVAFHRRSTMRQSRRPADEDDLDELDEELDKAAVESATRAKRRHASVGGRLNQDNLDSLADFNRLHMAKKAAEKKERRHQKRMGRKKTKHKMKQRKHHYRANHQPSGAEVNDKKKLRGSALLRSSARKLINAQRLVGPGSGIKRPSMGAIAGSASGPKTPSLGRASAGKESRKTSVLRLSAAMSAELLRRGSDAQSANARKKRGSSRKGGGNPALAKRLHEAFQAIDVDHDHEIDFEEFKAIIAPKEEETEAVNKLFDLIDEDDNGTIEESELVHALQSNKEAIALAKRFDNLSKLVGLDRDTAQSIRRERARAKRRSTKKKKRKPSRRRMKPASGGEAAADAKDAELPAKPGLNRSRSGTLKSSDLDALHAASQAHAAKTTPQQQRPTLARRRSGTLSIDGHAAVKAANAAHDA